MTVSRIDILNKIFRKTFHGYSPQEVDIFLQEIADSLGQLHEEKNNLINRLSLFELQLKEYKERENALKDTFIAAQKMIENIQFVAEKEAKLIIEAAQAKAENMLQQSNLHLAHIQEAILETKKIKTQFEIRIRSSLESHLKLLDLMQTEDEKLEAIFSRSMFDDSSNSE